MRINRYIAQHAGLSRRAADTAVEEGRVFINGQIAALGSQVITGGDVTLDGKPVVEVTLTTIALNKPAGYVTSRRQQGSSHTIYELLPTEMRALKPVGRLDKESCGLLLLTNDGELAYRLTHPRHEHTKTYYLEFESTISAADAQKLTEQGVQLDDGLSRFRVELRDAGCIATLQEGRNRQLRRSFGALGYSVTLLRREAVGALSLAGLAEGEWRTLSAADIEAVTA